jgi:hypothetical protein
LLLATIVLSRVRVVGSLVDGYCVDLEDADQAIFTPTGNEIIASDGAIRPGNVPDEATVPIQFNGMVKAAVRIGAIHFDCVHGCHNQREALRIRVRQKGMCDVGGVMVKLDPEACFLAAFRRGAYTKLVKGLPVCQTVRTNRFHDHQIAVSCDESEP